MSPIFFDSLLKAAFKYGTPAAATMMLPGIATMMLPTFFSETIMVRKLLS
jgi:hypothetical protein